MQVDFFLKRSATRGVTRRRARLAIEPLEDRKLLDATGPVQSLAVDMVYADAQPAAVASAPAAESGAPSGTISLIRQGALIETFDPATDTDIDRGMALRDALAAGQIGDQLLLDSCTYDMGSDAHVELPKGVTVSGAGQTLTHITSSAPQWVDGFATFTLNNETVVEDCSLEGTLRDGNFQPLVGEQGDPGENVTAYLRNVNISGDSDGIFIWTGQQFSYTINAFNCNISTKYDAVAVLGSGFNPQRVNLYGCTISVSQPDPIPAHLSNCVNVRSGVVALYGCTLNSQGDENSLSTNGIISTNHGFSQVVDCTFNVSSPAGQVFDLNIQDANTCTVAGGTGSAPDGSYLSYSNTEFYYNPPPATVAGQSVFYNNSFYDGFNPLPNADDAGAIATDKTAYLPDTGAATFANVTSYAKGLNGIMLDVSGVHGNITADDFVFKLGNDNAPETWTAADAMPNVTVRPGGGAQGSDRIELIWPDGAIQGTWLQVTLLANSDTRLAADHVFYLGNAVGDSGLGDDADTAKTDILDEIAARNNPQLAIAHIPASNSFDYNRDGKVDVRDQLLSRNGGTTNATAPKFIVIETTPITPPETPSVAAGNVGNHVELAAALIGRAAQKPSGSTKAAAARSPKQRDEPAVKTELPAAMAAKPVTDFALLQSIEQPRPSLAKAVADSEPLDLDDALLHSLATDWRLKAVRS